MFARLQQSMLNALTLMRVVARGIAAEEPSLDPTRRYFYGISLGGIMGTVYTALSPDIDRSVLEVIGAPFGLLLPRSRQFDLFNTIVDAYYQDPRDARMVLALVQMLWDRVEPTGYLPFLGRDTLPGVDEPRILVRASVGDHSVSPLGAHFVARTLGIPHVQTGTREVWGLEPIDTPLSGSGFVEYDFGVPPEPACSVPNRICTDPHARIRSLPEAGEQLEHFFRTGEIVNTCPNGICVFPELSGCVGNENNDAVCMP
jgi:hypothetical protein